MPNTREEVIGSLVQRRSACQEEIRAWEELKKNGQFVKYLDSLRSFIRARRNQDAGNLIPNLDSAFMSAGVRAEIAAFQYSIMLCDSEIDNLRGEIDNINTELESWQKQSEQPQQ